MNTNLESLVKYQSVLVETSEGKEVQFSVAYFAYHGVLEQLARVSQMLTFMLDNGHYMDDEKVRAEYILVEVDKLHKQYSCG